MAADLGLVAHAAHRDALELPPHGVCDRPAERRLADAGRSDEAEDRGARVRLQAAHGEELEDAVLYALDVVVVAVEHLARMGEVEVVIGRDGPGERREPLEVGPDHAVLGRLRRQALKARELAFRLLHGVLGETRRLDLRTQLLRLDLLLVELAELLLDRFHLLAQEPLALALLHLRLDLRLDGGADLDELELAGEQLGEHAQALGHVALLEQRLLLLGLDAQGARDHAGELRRVVEVRDRHLQLLGQVGHLLDDAREGRLHVAVERLELRRRLDYVGRLLDAGDQVGVGRDEVPDLDALGTVHEDAQRSVGDLEHPRHDARDADAVEIVGAGLLGLRVA